MEAKWLNFYLRYAAFTFALKQKMVQAQSWIKALPYAVILILVELAFAIIALPLYFFVSPKNLQERGFVFPLKEQERVHYDIYIVRRRISLTTVLSAAGIWVAKAAFVAIVSFYLLGAQQLLAATQNWDFNTASDYTYDPSKIAVTGGAAQLVDQGTGGSCGGTATACNTFSSTSTCQAQSGCSWGGSASGATTNPSFDTNTTGWTYTDWESANRVSGVRVTTGGNPSGYVNISMTASKNNTASGYWQQSFVASSSPTALLSFDHKITAYSASGLTSFIIYAFVDSASGAPTLGTEVWSKTVTSTTGWISVTNLDVSSKIATAGTYYLKIAARRITGGGASGTNTVGFDNVQLSWSKSSTCSGTATTCNTFSTSTTCGAQAGCSWSSVPVYPTDKPTIYPNSSLAPSNLTRWNSFAETATKGTGEIYYQLSDDNGTTWKYWNNTAWATSTTSTDYNTASVINTNISTFSIASGQIKWKAFLSSDGSQQVILDNVAIGYVQNDPPSISNLSPSQDTSTGYVHVNYSLTDLQSDPTSLVTYEYSLTGAFAGEQSTMTAVPTDPAHSGVSGLSSSPSGVAHTFVWNALTDLGNVYSSTVYVRLRPNDGIANGNFATSTAITVDYVNPVVTNVTAVQAPASSDINIGYDLVDNSSSNILVELQVSSDGGLTWTVPVSSVSGDIGSSVTSGNGKAIVWHAGTDFSNQENANMMVRVRAKDKYQNQGSYTNSAVFALDNKAPVVATTANLLAQPIAGATTTMVGGSFTESNPNTNDFYVAINGGSYGSAQPGDTDTATPAPKSLLVGATLRGSDYISSVKIVHTDDYGHTTVNENTSISDSLKYVKPYTPAAPSVVVAGETSVNVTINKNPLEVDGLEYAIFESTGSNYVQGDGSLSSSPYWHTIGAVNVTGLSQPIANYIFQVKSRNSSDLSHTVASESDLSSGASSDYHSPQITINSVSQTTDGSKYVVINYTGTGDVTHVNNLATYEYSTDGSVWQPMTEKTGVGSSGTTGLSFTGSGAPFNFAWDVGIDLSNAEDPAVYVRLKSNDSITDSNLAQSGSFVVDTAGPVISNVSANQVAGTNNVTINYDIADAAGSGNVVEVLISDDSGTTYAVATTTLTGDVGSNITAGVGRSVSWNAGVNFANQENSTMRVKISAVDSLHNSGNYTESSNFSVDTKAPVISGVTAAQTSGSALVTVNYTLSDLSVSAIEFEVSSDSGVTWVVPTTTYSGEVGAGISAGARTFYWNAAVDFPDQELDTMRVRVRALDNFNHQGSYTESIDFSLNSKILAISNITAVQNIGAKTVTIHYDLNKTATITLDISADSGVTWTVATTTLTGSVNTTTSAGTHKTINWNPGIDFNNGEIPNMRVRMSGVDVWGVQSPYYESADFSVDTAAPLGLSSFSKFASTPTSVTLNWSSGLIDSHFNHYELWHGATRADVLSRSGTASKWSVTNDANLGSISTVSTIITGITLSSDYYVKIWAIDDYGNETTIDDINAYTAPTQGSLVVNKVVVNDNGGTAVVSDFSLYVGATLVANGSSNQFAAGNYAITEDGGPAGYNTTFSGDCDASGNIAIVAGNSYTCTITNNDIQPKVTINKSVINDNTGTAVASDFSLFVGLSPVSNGVQSGIDVGSYTVNESGPSGYAASFSGDCNASGLVALNIGEVKTCTITNNDNPPPPPTQGALTVNKVLVNDNGGTAVVSNFTLKVGTTTVTNGVSNNFYPGSYSVTETGPSGYSATYSGDCDASGNIDIVAGNTYTCTITNNDIQPRITVTKVVVNDNGGTSTAANFPLFVGLTSATSGVQLGVDAGTYTVNESNSTGYTASFSGDCDSSGQVTLSIGDVKTCTITNDDIPPPPPTQGTLTVTKVVINDDAGAAAVGDFALKVGATAVVSGATNNFTAGTYNISETGPSGYTNSYSGDCDNNGNINVVAGHDYSCTITNNDIASVAPPSGGGGGTQIDVTPPTKPILTPVVSPTQDTSILISGLAEGGAQIDLYDNGVLVGRLNNAADVTGRFSQTFNFAIGDHKLTVKAVDSWGNVSEASDVANLSIIPVVSEAPIVLSPKDGDSITDPEPSVVGVSAPLYTIEITLDGNNTFTTKADPDGGWQFKIPNSFALKDGEHTFSVRAIDSKGKRSPEAKLTVNKVVLPLATIINPLATTTVGGLVTTSLAATNLPTISIPVPPASLIGVEASAVELPGVPVPEVTNVNLASINDTFTFTGTALPNQDVIVYVHSDQALIYRTRTDANGVWTIKHSQDLAELTPGEHSIYAVAVDQGAKIKSRPSPVAMFTVQKSWWVSVFKYLNLQTTIVTLMVLGAVIIWLYRLKRVEV